MAEIKKNITCQEIMNSNVVHVAPHESIIKAIEILQEKKIRHLPIIENNQVVGILSDRDTRQVLAIIQVMGITLEQARGELKVSEFMATPVKTIKPDALAVDAAYLMIDEKIGCLPISDGEKIVGILTETDIMKQFITDHSA